MKSLNIGSLINASITAAAVFIPAIPVYSISILNPIAKPHSSTVIKEMLVGRVMIKRGYIAIKSIGPKSTKFEMSICASRKLKNSTVLFVFRFIRIADSPYLVFIMIFNYSHKSKSSEFLKKFDLYFVVCTLYYF